MTNTLTRTKALPKTALGFDSQHVANLYAVEFIREKRSDLVDPESDDDMHVPMYDPSDPDETERQLDTYFDATDQPRQTIWR